LIFYCILILSTLYQHDRDGILVKRKIEIF